MSQGMEVAFAGRLASMTQREAADRVGAAGGRVVREPSVHTDYLVVGHGAWPLGSDGLPDRGVLRTRRLKEQYPDLRIVSETTFLEMLGLAEKVEDLQRLFTTAQLSRILGVPVPQIRSWMRSKLIRPAKVARRLAWFDFREVAMARALHTLTSAGVSTARIGRSIRDLAQWLPDAERMLNQLETLSPDHKLSIRLADGSLVEPAGQRLLDFHGGVADPAGNIRALAPGEPAAGGAAPPIDFPLPAGAPPASGDASGAAGRAPTGLGTAVDSRTARVLDLHARAGGRGGAPGQRSPGPAPSSCSSAPWRPRTPASGSWRSNCTRAPSRPAGRIPKPASTSATCCTSSIRSAPRPSATARRWRWTPSTWSRSTTSATHLRKPVG